MINPITLLNANIKTPKIFNKKKKDENQDNDDAEVIVKKTPDDTDEVSI